MTDARDDGASAAPDEPVAVQLPLWEWEDDRPHADSPVAPTPASTGTLPEAAATGVLSLTQPVLTDASDIVTASLRELGESSTRELPDAPDRHYRPRRLGDTTLTVFPVVLGAARLGSLDTDDVGRILDSYSAAGGNALDISSEVDDGRGERLVGEWLRDRGARERTVLSMTVSGRGLSARGMNAAVDSALGRLGTDRIDLLWLRDDAEAPLEESLTAAESLIVSGKVRYIAACGHSPERLMEARVTAGQLGMPRFVAVRTEYSLLAREHFEQSLSTVARAQELAVVPHRALAAGFLSGRQRNGRRPDRADPPFSHPDDVAPHLGKRGYRVLDALASVADEHSAPVPAVALAWLLTKPLITAPIVGVTRPEQVAGLVRAASTHLTRAQVALLDRVSAH